MDKRIHHVYRMEYRYRRAPRSLRTLMPKTIRQLMKCFEETDKTRPSGDQCDCDFEFNFLKQLFFQLMFFIVCKEKEMNDILKLF